MAKWINRSIIAAPRNGTVSHTISFTAATAGNLLVAVIEGAVTSTTPTGWTLPAGGSAVNNTGLYVWYKTATAGEASFTTTHNGSNYPVISAVYEFPAGSTFVAAASAISQPAASSGPTLSGLTGTNSLFGMTARGVVNSDVATYTWSAPAGILEDIDQGVISSGTDGYAFSLAYLDDSTATSWNPSSTATSGGSEFERITFAVKVTAASGTAFSGTAAFTGTGTLGAAGTATVSRAVALSGSGVLSATSSQTVAGAAALGGTGSLAATGKIAAAAAVSLSGAGSLSATGVMSVANAYSTTASLSGTGTLSATGNATATVAVTLTGSGTLSVTTSLTVQGSVALSGSGTLSASGPQVFAAIAALAGSGALTANGRASENLWRFNTPSFIERTNSRNPLLARTKTRVGISVLKENGFYRQVRYPSDEEIAAADVTYLGGYDHTVSGAEAAALRAAGYTDLKPIAR